MYPISKCSSIPSIDATLTMARNWIPLYTKFIFIVPRFNPSIITSLHIDLLFFFFLVANFFIHKNQRAYDRINLGAKVQSPSHSLFFLNISKETSIESFSNMYIFLSSRSYYRRIFGKFHWHFTKFMCLFVSNLETSWSRNVSWYLSKIVSFVQIWNNPYI